MSPRRTRSLSGKRTESNHAAPSGNRRAEPAGKSFARLLPPPWRPRPRTHLEPFVKSPRGHAPLIEANRAPKAAKAPGLAQLSSAVASELSGPSRAPPPLCAITTASGCRKLKHRGLLVWF